MLPMVTTAATPSEISSTPRPPAEPPPDPITTSPENPPGSIISTLYAAWSGSNFYQHTTIPADIPSTPTGTPAETPYSTCVPDSVIRINVHPRVFGIRWDGPSYVRIIHRNKSLMDGGANIYLTGDLSCLQNITDIPPMPITVATTGNDQNVTDCCTKRGFLPLSLPNGTVYWQPCFYCTSAVDTIISPQAILASSNIFTSWNQTGYKDGRPGTIRFTSFDGLQTMDLPLDFDDGLYYCPTDVFTIDTPPELSEPHTTTYPSQTPMVCCILHSPPIPTLRRPTKYQPTTKSKQLESELWLLCLGSPGVTMLDALPRNVTGIPAVFEHHPFRFVDFKAQAGI
jgi:hypothetical protein